jgi:pyruvate/2-oxoacid:ferredoxin oxidoreductase alpha subunit
MGTVNAINPNTDLSVRVFDSFYRFAQDVPADEYDVVNSYFKSVFGTAQAASNFTTTLFRIANQSKIPVLSLLQQIQGQSQPQLTLTLTYYLNGLRSPATLLGVNVPSTPTYFVARNIKA